MYFCFSFSCQLMLLGAVKTCGSAKIWFWIRTTLLMLCLINGSKIQRPLTSVEQMGEIFRRSSEWSKLIGPVISLFLPCSITPPQIMSVVEACGIIFLGCWHPSHIRVYEEWQTSLNLSKQQVSVPAAHSPSFSVPSVTYWWGFVAVAVSEIIEFHELIRNLVKTLHPTRLYSDGLSHCEPSM